MILQTVYSSIITVHHIKDITHVVMAFLPEVMVSTNDNSVTLNSSAIQLNKAFVGKSL